MLPQTQCGIWLTRKRFAAFLFFQSKHAELVVAPCSALGIPHSEFPIPHSAFCLPQHRPHGARIETDQLERQGDQFVHTGRDVGENKSLKHSHVVP